MQPNNYFHHTAIVVVMVVAVFSINHLFSPLGTTVKQLDPARSQLVQKPVALSFQIPTLCPTAREPAELNHRLV